MILRFEECAIDIDRRELRRGGESIHIEPQVFDLLVYLATHRDRVVGKDELFSAVWSGRLVSDATLASRINAARVAIGDSGQAQRLLRTIPKRGFRFVGEVARESETHAGEPGQSVNFCRSADGVALAVATSGDGEVLIKTANWLTHVEHDWSSPVWGPTFRRWSAGHRFVRYDARGTGLSDREPPEFSFAGFERDFEAVVESVGAKRFAILGMSQGASVAIAYAARHPERVTKLVLHGAYALGRIKRDRQADTEQAAAYLTLIRHGWGYANSAFMKAFSALYLPNGTPEQIQWFCDLQRKTTSPDNAIAIRTSCDEIDVTPLLAQVRAPTLVLHSRHDSVVPFDHGRRIAVAIPNARFVGLESANHVILPQEPAWAQFMAEIDAFLS